MTSEGGNDQEMIKLTRETTPAESSRASEPLFSLEKVERTYRLGGQEVHALKGVDLTVHEGTFVALYGRSGSGKTTLLNLLGGLDRPTKGQVRYFGRDLSRYSGKELTRWRRSEVGLVFQAFALLPALTAFENVELPLRIAGVSPKVASKKAMECLELVGLAKRAHHRSFELSGGEQQRVGIARALVTEPRLILADEPTGELDVATGAQILSFFRSIVESQSITICMATHDPVVESYADVTYRLVDGKLIEKVTAKGAAEE